MWIPSDPDILDRVLLSSIRNLGACPCPRCLIPKTRIHNLGKIQDRKERVTKKRVDDNERRHKVTTARKFIYDQHHTVDSAAVDAVLKPQSLVPTTVRI